MRGAPHDVGENTQNDGGNQRRRATGNQNGQKRRVHGTNVRCTRGEQVVRIEVQQDNNQKRRLPGQAHTTDDFNDGIRKPRDQTVFLQVRGHRNQRGKPGQSIPSWAFSQALFPGDDAGNEQNSQAVQSRSNRADADRGTNDPKQNRQTKRKSHDFLVARHRTEFCQLLFSFRRRFWRVFHLWRVQNVQHQRREDQADQTWYGSR